jgi:5-methyltetrahydropteroyltriglutamate--homocysteine methyltransferase
VPGGLAEKNFKLGQRVAVTDALTRFNFLQRQTCPPIVVFASTEAGNALSEANQKAKLKLVVETAREVWG